MIRFAMLALTLSLWALAFSPVAANQASEQSVAREIVKRINDLREKNALAPLQANEALTKAAEMHSQDMVVHDFFDHVSPLPGKTQPSDRARLFRYPQGSTLAENLFMSMGALDEVPSGCLASWMESPGHLKNLLNPTRTDIGVGVALSSQGEFYVTAMFGRP